MYHDHLKLVAEMPHAVGTDYLFDQNAGQPYEIIYIPPGIGGISPPGSSP